MLNWFLALLLALPLAATARQDHIREKAWLEDPSGQLSWSDVQQKTAQPYTGMLSKGFGKSVIWLKLRIDPGVRPAPNKEPDRMVLRIRPVYLDDIQIYDPLAPQGLAGTTGDRHHPRLDEFQGLDFFVPIARGTEPRDIWLRLVSSSTRQIDVQALDLDDLNQRTRLQQLVFAVYIGLILIFAIWAFVYWLFSREQLIGIFCLTQTAALFYALGSLGYLRAFWPVGWSASSLDQTVTFFSITAVSSAVLFHILLLRELGPPRWMQRLHIGMVALLPVKLVLMAFIPILALRINMLEVLVSPIVFLCTVFLARGWSSPDGEQKPPLAKAVVVVFYTLLLAALAIAALAGLGLARSGEIALHIVQVHGLVTAFFVLLMLQYRAHVINQQRHTISLALERSQLQAQQEREIREEQEKLLTMLAHELKTPLSTMHMRLDAAAQGSKEIKQAIRDMNSVIERCLQTTQLGDRQLRAHFETVNVINVIQDAVSCCKQPDRIHMDLPAHMTIQTDRQLLFIVLSNLLENACKYASPETPIFVRMQSKTYLTSGQFGMRLQVCNTPGPAGWPEPDKVFDKYYRSPSARRQAGTGLGLFLVRNVVQILGGRINYTPDSTQIGFTLQLPEAANNP